MKFYQKFVVYFALILQLGLCEASPLSVTVIGGGPAGLSAAIQAHLLGANVTVIEKREAYTRNNVLFLYGPSLKVFKQWGVEIPQIEILNFQGQKRGLVLIKDLEEALRIRASDLGIRMIHGTFEDFAGTEKSISIATPSEYIELPYDIAVVADGAHSQARSKLGISTYEMGTALGAVAVLPKNNCPGEICVQTTDTDAFFAKNITTPSRNIILMQSRPNRTFQQVSEQEVTEVCYELNWFEEAGLMAENCLLFLDSIPISLKRAEVFSDRNRDVILLGDAAACTSFFEGQGTNTAVAEIAFFADFLVLFQQNPETAHELFNTSMERKVDSVIEKNSVLFLSGQ